MKNDFFLRIKLALIFSILLLAENSIFGKMTNEDVEPGIDDFVACESEPKVDMIQLMQCVKYPDIARRDGVQGRVIVRSLIGKKGEVLKSVVEESEHITLNDAALKAVNECAVFKPAIQKGEPILCWISIPITFKLRETVVEPDIDDIIEVEKEPWVDLDKMAECVEEHDKSRLSGKQSLVIIRALIGLKGEVIKSELEKTDNITLVETAMKVVNECAKFNPAIQKGQPVLYWVSIPVNFKLKEEEIEPDIDDFIRVDVDPELDLNKLMKCVEYPDISRRAGIQGRVIVRALIGMKGEVLKTVIEDTDNVTLNDAALKAVKECGDFKPAIQKGKPIICWVSIPVTFRLED